MCVAAIIHKPISLQYMRDMHRENPHGAGVAWCSAGQIQFRRGLDAERVYALQETGALTYPYLLHFRWATHGNPVPELTHPFPTGPRAFLGELAGAAEEVLIHNGVWREYDSWAKWLPEELFRRYYDETSDTAIAAYFYYLIPDLGDEIPWAVASARVVDGHMHIRRHGGWSQHEGNEYSNLLWLRSSEYWAERHWKEDKRGGWTWSDDKPTFDWEDYIKSRYGTEVADAVAEADPSTDDDAELMAKLADAEAQREVMDELGLDCEDYGDSDLIETLDGDMISDDPNVVNKWLASKSARNFLIKKGA